MHIVEDDLWGEKIRALLDYHFKQMHENSPPGMAYVLDIAGLKAPGISFWTVWDGDELLGCGALKELAPDWGEIKSMRTAPEHVGKGAGAAMLDNSIGVARARGYRRISLETGTTLRSTRNAGSKAATASPAMRPATSTSFFTSIYRRTIWPRTCCFCWLRVLSRTDGASSVPNAPKYGVC